MDNLVKQETEKKKTGEDSFFFGNLKDIQIITIFAAFSAVVITMILMAILPETVDRGLIIYTLIGVSVFLAFYLSTPSLSLSSNFTYWPDVVFVIALTLISYALKSYSDFYFVLFIVLIAVDAFALRFRHYVLIVSLITISVLFSNLVLAKQFLSQEVIVIRTLIQVYSVLVSAIVMRFFAFRALNERQEKEKIKRLADNTLSAIKNLRTLLDNIGDGIFAVDKDEKVNTSNTAAINILNWRDPIINKKITEIIPFKDSELKDVDPVREVIETGKPYQGSDLLIQKDNEQMKLYVNIAPIFEGDNEVNGAIVIFRDITKEKEIEEQRMEFVAVSSHELRTPLTIMEGYLFYVLNNSSKLKYDEQTRIFIEKAHNSAVALEQLITDLLDVSRLDRNKMTLNQEELDLSLLAEGTVDELSRKAKESGLKLELKTFNKKIPKVLADKERIKEVIVNLITNAIKFTQKGKVVVGVETDRSLVTLSVKDGGIGISKEDQRFIFNKFYRAENWQTKKTRGTGLGLYISRQIVEMHKGRIWAESTLGKGSTFYFSLPVLRKAKLKRLTKPKIEKPKKLSSKELEDLVTKL